MVQPMPEFDIGKTIFKTLPETIVYFGMFSGPSYFRKIVEVIEHAERMHSIMAPLRTTRLSIRSCTSGLTECRQGSNVRSLLYGQLANGKWLLTLLRS